MIRRFLFWFTAAAAGAAVGGVALVSFLAWSIRVAVQVVCYGAALLVLAVYLWHLWPLISASLRGLASLLAQGLGA